MIDLTKIIDDAYVESVQSIYNGAAYNERNNEALSQANVYKAIMKYSLTLLKSYHEALREELSNHGIEI